MGARSGESPSILSQHPEPDEARTRSKSPLLIKYDFGRRADVPGASYAFPLALSQSRAETCWYASGGGERFMCRSYIAIAEERSVTYIGNTEPERARGEFRIHRGTTEDWLEPGQLATTQSVISFFLKPACTSPLSLCPFRFHLTTHRPSRPASLTPGVRYHVRSTLRVVALPVPRPARAWDSPGSVVYGRSERAVQG